MSNNKKIYDISIIGGGPIGLFAATYAGMRMAKVQLLESLGQLGGQPQALFPEKNIYDIPGFTEISGRNLIKDLVRQAKQFGAELYTNNTVLNIEKDNRNDYFIITTNTKISYTKSIIIATGIGSFEPRRLRIDNAKDLENNKIFYTVDNLNKFFEKTVAIAGGGDSAVDWALEINKVAKKVILIHRRNQFRAMESNVKKVIDSNIDILTPYTISEIIDKSTDIELFLKKVRSDESTSINPDFLLVSYGFMSNNKVIKNWNLDLKTSDNLITVNSKLETNIPNVYAIGDIATYSNRIDLIAVGMGEAPMAVNNALETIYPDKQQPKHSTQLVQKTKK